MADGEAVYVGIDLSTSEASTGVCRLRWGAELEIDTARHLTVDEVLSEDFVAAAIDVPFGWPVDFVAAVAEWTQRGASGQPLASRLITDGYAVVGERLRFRTTDRFIRKAAKFLPDAAAGPWPDGLSVTKDMLTGTALHGMHIVGSRVPDHVVGRSYEETPSRIVEAYPSAALVAWGFDARGLKDKGDYGFDARAAVLNEIAARIPEVSSTIRGHETKIAATGDLFDGFICALVARAWHLGKCWLPDDPTVWKAMSEAVEEWVLVDGELKDRERFLAEVHAEGWIALPRAPLAVALTGG
jgi:hypothetical protein